MNNKIRFIVYYFIVVPIITLVIFLACMLFAKVMEFVM